VNDPFPLVSKIEAVGADMRVVGLDSAPPPRQVRTLDGGTWERPFAAPGNYYMRRPRAGEIMREFQNSECVTWGAARVFTSIVQAIEDDEPPSVDDRYLYFQRWHFPADFEAYGVWCPFFQITPTEDEFATLQIKLALFKTFPIENTTQAWQMLPGATFSFAANINTDFMRRVLIQPEPTNYGRVIIPAGWYYLLILPNPPLNGFAFTRIVRDYDNDLSNIWRSDRVTTIDVGGDWDGFDLASIEYQNDGSAPPQGTTKWNNTYPRWVLIDFAFGGRFV